MSELDLRKTDLYCTSSSRHRDSNAQQDSSISTFLEPELRLQSCALNDFSLRKKSQAENLIPQLMISSKSDDPGNLAKPGDYSESMMINGVSRQYHLHVPPNYDSSKPVPLVLVLHGHGDDAAGVSRISGMDAEADKNGFIVAYPESMHWLGSKSLAAWDTGNGLLPPFAHVDDVGFLRKVIETCQSKLSIDQKRTYLVGFSNGAMEAYKAAPELSDKLAAVVAVSGAMSGAEGKPKSPVSILSLAGTADDGVPFTGRTKKEEVVAATPSALRLIGQALPVINNKFVSPVASVLLRELAMDTGFVPEFKPITYTTDFWKSADGITASGTTTHNGGITSETYTNPKNGVEVKQEIVAGGDHMIQHGAPPGFNLADEVWNFLDAHPKSN